MTQRDTHTYKVRHKELTKKQRNLELKSGAPNQLSGASGIFRSGQ